MMQAIGECVYMCIIINKIILIVSMKYLLFLLTYYICSYIIYNIIGKVMFIYNMHFIIHL